MASDDLYLFDMRKGEDLAQWIIVPVVGPTPGRRYGHVISFCMPYLIIFGGNTGSESVNDSWCLSVEKAPFSWVKIIHQSEAPPPRVYHAAAQCLTGCAAGMMLVFGGRATDQSALNDAWGLRRHRDGSWDWVKAPYRKGTTPPVARYQHSQLFLATILVVIGGRTIAAPKPASFEAYDTESSEWFSYPPIKRFRHASWAVESLVYVHGGFELDSPNVPSSSIIVIDSSKLFKLHEALSPKEPMRDDYKAPAKAGGTGAPNPPHDITLQSKVGAGPGAALGRVDGEEEKVFRLSTQAHVAASFNQDDPENDLSNFVRKVPIEKLQEEAKKIGGNQKVKTASLAKNPKDSLCALFLNHLLKPQDYSKTLAGTVFRFSRENVLELAKECQAVVSSEPAILAVRTPVKVYGNLCGNYQDLMRFFELFKAPTESTLGGDIESVAYVFLGNYVDRGNRSLETICLLMALKLKYRDNIHLLRGSHEDRTINAVYGFGEECKTRLHEDIAHPTSVFQTINNMFGWLPLATLIENKIVCVHAGIGPNFTKLDDLLKLHRPIELEQEKTPAEQGVLYDLLWSDPTDTETELGYRRNYLRDHLSAGNIVRYGADKMLQFLQSNNLDLMIRGHEIAIDGFDMFADSRLITVTSCTDYCGKHNNSACMLVIQKTFEIVPKLLLPVASIPKAKLWIDSEESLQKRGPTPPRQRSSLPKPMQN